MFDLKHNYLTDKHDNKIAVQMDVKTFMKIEEVLENYGLYKLLEEEANESPMELKEAKAYYKRLKKKK